MGPQSKYSRYEWDPGKLLLQVLVQGGSWFISAGAIRGHERPKSNPDLLIGVIGSSTSLLLGKLPHWQESTSLLRYTRQEPWIPESVSPAHSPPQPCSGGPQKNEINFIFVSGLKICQSARSTKNIFSKTDICNSTAAI